MIGSVLIANRGEIARRIIRTARRLGIRCVAVYSEADAGAPHVREADEAFLIGPPPPGRSYLRGEKILEAARQSGAEAIHPGYGFLSENADFAEAVVAAGLVWIGPPPAAILTMGRKDAAKRLMDRAGVPVTPGYLGEDQSPGRLASEAAAIGWPVMVKAVAGGGGKGMRRVDRPEDFHAALQGAKREATSAFGDDHVLIEAFVARPRHIEVQVFADGSGDIVHLFERDCSIQRRHQKVIEEAPAPGMNLATREHLCAAAVRAARAVDYQGAGTIEFIADASEGLRSDRIWFMEMNTRLQVEHPVTEAITGVDLVEWQIRIASGESLPLRQDQIAIRGHAIEARLYAEDPARGFLPSSGPLKRWRLPREVRVDSGFEEGDTVSAFYDPMLAKLIAHADNRAAAVSRLERACAAVEVWPVKTNAAFLARCLSECDFLAGEFDTGFIASHSEYLTAKSIPSPAAAASLAGAERMPSPWSSAGGATGFRLNAAAARRCRIFVDGESQELELDFEAMRPSSQADGERLIVFERGAAFSLALQGESSSAEPAAGADGAVRAPMPGRVTAVFVKKGDRVKAGESLATLEAMKMEHVLTAAREGTIEEAPAKAGDQVVEGAVLVRLRSPV
ncbi:MAG TPA: biotin carboxylase N-terminal domain-containing protein [Caulobacteraceae bacterium]